MAYDSDSLWDDKDFLIEAGELPDQGVISGTNLGAGIIYSAPLIHLTHRWTRSGAVEIASSTTTRDFVLWCTGAQSVIENPTGRSSPYIRVALKPSPALMQAIPQAILGEAYACLLYGNYAESFRRGVTEDLMAVRAFAEQIRDPL